MQKTSQQHGDEMNQVPQPRRNGVGGTDPGPRNVPLDRQNPDILTPPSTDSGTIPNLKFSFSMAHNRLDGRARLTAIDQDGRTFIDDVGVGDLWYFPAGFPHSIQGLEQ